MIEATSGSDIRLQFTVGPDTLVLAGFTLTILLTPSSGLEGRVSAAWVDVAERRLDVFIEGTNPLPVGVYAFRVQFNNPSGDSFATPAITVRIY